MKKHKVLFLSAWYPNRYDAMAGLFVRKHALAISKYADLCVLFPCEDKNITDFEIVTQKTEDILEVYVYYPFSKNNKLRKISKAINYIRAYKKGYSIVKQQFGEPNICHINVLTRAGILPYVLKVFHNIPYIITEHWTRYFAGHQAYRSKLHQYITQQIVHKSSYVLTVSKQLTDAMKQRGLMHKNYKEINNVVDDFFYETPHCKRDEKITIVNITCFDEQAKNLLGLLRTICRISEIREDFELILVGTGKDFDMIVKECRNLELFDTIVHFVGEKTPQEVSDILHQSDFLVLSSNYETAPVVVREALASGIPVVSTAVGNIPDLITNETGRIVPIKDEDALYEQLLWMIDHCREFSPQRIQKTVENHRFNIVGEQISKIYDNILL